MGAFFFSWIWHLHLNVNNRSRDYGNDVRCEMNISCSKFLFLISSGVASQDLTVILHRGVV